VATLAVLKKTWLDLYIQSDEELGILDTSYVEDYYGVDGQLTLHHVSTGQEFDILMSEIPGGGPAPHDYFKGTISVANMPLGLYEIRGRVRDVLGHYTILTSFSSPMGGERVIDLSFILTESLCVTISASVSALSASARGEALAASAALLSLGADVALASLGASGSPVPLTAEVSVSSCSSG
jgi:hypothetical protein